MISLKELNPHSYPTTDKIDNNLQTLLERINKIRIAYNVVMIVTSGLRSDADQKRINPKVPHSHHLAGEAVDISDPDGKLKAWVMQNIKLLEEVGLWCEDFSSTTNWVHFQISEPASGHRFFIP